MGTISLRLPNSLHDQVRKLSKQDGVSINQFITTALAEKMSAFMTSDYLAERARKGDKASFLKALGKVPNVEPSKGDEVT